MKRPWLRQLVRWGLGIALVLALIAVTLNLAFPFPTGRLAEAARGGSAMILDRDGRMLAWRVGSAEEFRLPVPFRDVSPWLAKATVAAEDRRFFSHRGVDPLALARAAGQNLSSGRRVSGASTLTMQTVRLLWPRPRTWGAKAAEAFRALQLERAADKERILETYLNLAPYGGNAVGAEAAARLCFGKGAAELTLAEAAMLAGIPQSPARFNPRRHAEAALARREYVLGRMLELGLASPQDVERARREPVAKIVADCRANAECSADSSIDWLVGRLGRNCGAVRTTVDPGVQTLARAAAERHAAELRRQGVDGLAVVVVDVRRAELAAMVACSGDSEVNGAVAARQPGSLLKPFIYARAFDLGRLTPDAVVYDVPGRWSAYQPENFDRDFLGPMSAARALGESRNLPAVRTLAALGPEALARDLAGLGLALPRPAESYGLSLALGTAEVRLVDMANAYAALARLGRWRPLRIVLDGNDLRGGVPGRRGHPKGRSAPAVLPFGPDVRRSCDPSASQELTEELVQPVGLRPTGLNRAPAAQEPRGQEALSRQVFSPGAAYLALRCLGAPADDERRAAWKTGTSWNFRDAWAVAVTPNYAVGVWCGRLSGTGNPSLVGSQAALPLALELSGALPGASWSRPETVGLRRVCALSGSAPSDLCPTTIEAEHLRGVSPEAPCRLHRMIGGELATIWPPEVASFMEKRVKGPDPFLSPAAALHIDSPRPGAEYILAPGEERTLHLAARSGEGPRELWWFVDGRLLGRAAADRPMVWPMTPGAHEISACDAGGRSAAVRFSVRAELR